jgi:anti-sigma regulatory factor (Ser/Thr protein kinase)
MPNPDLYALSTWITEAAKQFPTDLTTQVAQRLCVSRRTAQRRLGKLVDTQWLLREGSSRRPTYRPGAFRQVVRRYPLQGLCEDLPWQRDFIPNFDLPMPARHLAQHAFTELLNNAIEHSGGTCVTVSMRQTPLQLQLLISDDGCGMFKRIDEAFQIEEPRLAMLALSKGRLTSHPERHTGRGLFFTARAADVVDLHANASAFQHRSWEPHQWHASRALPRQGTSVYVAISLQTRRTLDEVLRAYSGDGLSLGFERTVVPLRLMAGELHGLASRAQARRVGAGLDKFRRAEIDFTGIAEVGHGFADELFRVYLTAHPELELVPMHMSPPVRELIGSVWPEMARPR